MLCFNMPNPRLMEISAVPRINTTTSGGFSAGAVIRLESRAPNDMAPIRISVMEKKSIPGRNFFISLLSLAMSGHCLL